MSHFSVLVVGDVKSQLAPFQENNVDDCPREFLKFNDTEDELRKEYETEGVEMAHLPTGERLHLSDERFRVAGKVGIGSDTHRVPDRIPVKNVPFRELFATFDLFAASWSGTKKDPQKQRYGYWENPNAKWDWYRLGGRYSGRLLASTVQRGSADWDAPPVAKGWGDSARAGDLDWEGMRLKRIADREKWWAEAEGKDETLRLFDYDIRKGDSREQYVKRGDDFTVFAVVKDGKWYQRGEMGWWGAVAEEKDADAWAREIETLIKSLKPDDVVSIVDCHI